MNNTGLQEFKSAFSHAREVLHFNNAGIAPWSKQTLETVENWAKSLSFGGTRSVGPAFEETERTRTKLAQFIGTEASQIAFFTTCAAAISQVALGFPLKADDEIVVWDQEYPSNFHPWKIAAERVGAKLVIAKSDETLATPFANLEAVVTSKTRIIAVSWVQYRTGAQTDLQTLAKFAKARGIFTCVDVIQGVGAIPFHFDQSGLDAVCGGAHKWMTSPLSLGYLALKKQYSELLTPIMIGAMTYGGPDVASSLDTKMVEGMPKFEPGGRPMLEMVGFGKSLELYSRVGMDVISAEAERLSNLIAKGLREMSYVVHSPHGDKIKGAILNFSPSPQSPLRTFEEVDKRLTDVNVTFSKRAPGIRLAPHAFNTDEEVATLLSALAAKSSKS